MKLLKEYQKPDLELLVFTPPGLRDASGEIIPPATDEGGIELPIDPFG